MRVLLDTNILFSALGFPGVSGKLLERLVAEDAIVHTTDYILEELRLNIQEKFLPQQVRRAFDLLSVVMSTGKVHVLMAESYGQNLSEAKQIVNHEDAPILAAAMLPQVTYFVTGDKDFLDNPAVKQRLSSKMVRAADLLKRLDPNKDGT